MAKLVSKTYGEALFEIALEKNAVDGLAEEVKAVSRALADNEELTKLLNHPKVAKEEKLKVIENIFKGRVSDDLTGFLVLAVNKGRQEDIQDIFEYFTDRVREYNNIGVACITTPAQLSENEKEKVLQKLLATTEYTGFEMNYKVDASLIGGMIIRIGDRVVDSSIKTKLEELTRSLKKVQLA